MDVVGVVYNMKKLIYIFIVLFSLVSCEEAQEREQQRVENQAVEKRNSGNIPGNVGTMEFCTQSYNGHEYVICTVDQTVYCGRSVSVSIIHSPDCPCNKKRHRKF